MNCREFETKVREIGPGMTAGSFDAALDHSQSCERCASMLRDQRTLTAGLQMLAASDAGREASPAAEQAMLRAFRALRTSTPVARRREWAPWTWAAAAVLLLAFGVFAYRSIRWESQKVAGNDKTAILTVSPSPGSKGMIAQGQPSKQYLSSRKKPVATTRPSPPIEGMPIIRPMIRPMIREEMTLYAYETEDATDFFPVNGPVNGNDARAPMESGQLIRVLMPQSALAKFGLPVNLERGDIPVKADLLVGEDGLARAIRFVR
ncbi:MAG: hypothetical protein IPJ07_10375 [Acidobacteria bacterium]|nr:hypothetical protein [Acidobacteriota bacterium]